jgi:hypothetical protein
MKRSNPRIEFAIEVFVRGHSAGRSQGKLLLLMLAGAVSIGEVEEA